MSDVHSSEASEACSYVTLCLVNYFCLTVSDIEVTTKHNFIRTVLILDQTESTNRSIMQLKATFAKQSLVNSLDLSLSRQHYAVCVGTLNSNQLWFSKVVFAVRKEKWFSLASPALGSCCFYPYGWEVMLILVRKTHWYVEVLTSNFFSHENISSVYMANVRDLFVELQIWFGFPPLV